MLKRIRLAAALLFLFLFLTAAIDFAGLVPPVVKKYFLALQFIPSLLHFIKTPVLLSGGFVVVLFLTVLFGRLYCSTICPLGVIQDIIIRVKMKFRTKTRFRNETNYKKTRYTLLALVLITVFAGNMFLLGLFDPFSIAGRITNSFIQPILIFLNNSVSGLLSRFHIYSVPPFEYKMHPLMSYILPTVFLVFIAVLSVFKGRMFCTMLCPVGTLLGLVSKVTVFKLQIDKAGCKGCGVCEWVCKAGCIDSKAQSIDYERCVVCCNCINVCPKGVILIKGKSASGQNEIAGDVKDLNRRGFLRVTASLLGAGLLTGAQVKIYRENTIAVKKKFPVSPPGSKTIDRFKGTCTACQQCVSQCPTGVLQPSVNEYGWLGIGQPVMNFKYSYCNYDCVVCTEVCPAGALLPLTPPQKKLTQIGRVNFIKENCVVETQRTECGACSEHCPTKAVNMVPYLNLKIPQTRPELCVGCGACEYACPTIPHKAIYVEGSQVHATAQKAAVENAKLKTEVPQDFPF